MSGTFPTTVFFDDFATVGAYTVLNSLWGVYNSPGNAGFGLRRPAQVSVVTEATATSNGKALQIVSQNVGGVHQSGGLQLAVPQTYGQYELRVRVADDATNVTSGVCLLWPQSNRWPEEGELDFWETYGNRATRTPTQSYVHRPNSVPETTVAYDHVGIDQSDWHKIVCNWAPDEVSIGVDNGPQYMLTNNPAWIPNTPMQLAIQLDAWSATPPSAPIIMQVDYVVVRSWSPVTATASGLPRLGFNVPTTVAAAVTSTAATVPITPSTAMPTSGIYPVSLDLAGEMVTVAGASVSGSNLNLTGVTRSVNGVIRSHAIGDKVKMANPFKLAMGKAIGHTGRVIPPVNENFTNTAALVSNVLQPNGQVLAWMPCNPTGATTKRDAAWEQGQFSTFTNYDDAPSYGFWYPNTEGTAAVHQPPAYANANYNFIANVGQAFSGSGYAQVIITGDTWSKSYAGQLWRNTFQSGVDMVPTNAHTFYYSCRVRFHEAITHDNTVLNASDYGFTNHIQVYRTRPSNLVFVTLAAGQNLVNDDRFKWHVALDNRAYYGLPKIVDPIIPINSWIHVEIYLVISDGFDGRTGRLKIWIDGVLMTDYTGPTIADYWERIGVSWGNYGHGLGQSPVTMDYDEVLMSTVRTGDRLIHPQPTGGFG